MSELFRIGEAARLLGVSIHVVRRWVDDGVLSARRSDGGQRLVEGAELARLALARTEKDADGGDRDGRISARNRFEGLVTKVVTDDVMAQIEILSESHRFVSLMTREAAEALRLEPGVAAAAVVKSTNVIVERPRPQR